MALCVVAYIVVTIAPIAPAVGRCGSDDNPGRLEYLEASGLYATLQGDCIVQAVS